MTTRGPSACCQDWTRKLHITDRVGRFWYLPMPRHKHETGPAGQYHLNTSPMASNPKSMNVNFARYFTTILFRGRQVGRERVK